MASEGRKRVRNVHYECLNALREALETILSHIGSEYQITFA